MNARDIPPALVNFTAAERWVVMSHERSADINQTLKE